MKPYELHQGDCLKLLASMPERSVDCCVTSPPYFGLRDYGTAEWEGGDPGCDHREKEIRQRRKLAEAANACDGGVRTSEGRLDKDALWIPYKDKCGKCGAVRVDSQIGLEPTPDEFVAKLVAVFREVRRVLRDDGTLWLNIGDSYNAGTNSKRKNGTGDVGNWHTADETGGIRVNVASLKPKDLIGIPWRVAFALQADGWYLRQDIIWHKPNPMPESVRDRCTKAHEYVFLLSKSAKYYFDNEAIKEQAKHPNATASWTSESRKERSKSLGRDPVGNEANGNRYEGSATRNRRSVWTVNTKPYKGAHFATYPPALIEPCILAGSRKGGVVLDPFNGSGTTGEVAILNGRRYVGIELNAAYIKLAETRIDAAVKQSSGLLFQ